MDAHFSSALFFFFLHLKHEAGIPTNGLYVVHAFSFICMYACMQFFFFFLGIFCSSCFPVRGEKRTRAIY